MFVSGACRRRQATENAVQLAGEEWSGEAKRVSGVEDDEKRSKTRTRNDEADRCAKFGWMTERVEHSTSGAKGRRSNH